MIARGAAKPRRVLSRGYRLSLCGDGAFQTDTNGKDGTLVYLDVLKLITQGWP